jgi:hypothetical protein
VRFFGSGLGDVACCPASCGGLPPPGGSGGPRRACERQGGSCPPSGPAARGAAYEPLEGQRALFLAGSAGARGLVVVARLSRARRGGVARLGVWLGLARTLSRARRCGCEGQKLVERVPTNRAANHDLDPPRSEHATHDPLQLFTQLTLLRPIQTLAQGATEGNLQLSVANDDLVEVVDGDQARLILTPLRSDQG